MSRLLQQAARHDKGREAQRQRAERLPTQQLPHTRRTCRSPLICTSVTLASADSAPSKPRARSGQTASWRICGERDGGEDGTSSDRARLGRRLGPARHAHGPAAARPRGQRPSAAPPSPPLAAAAAYLVRDEQLAHLALNLLGHLGRAPRVRLLGGDGGRAVGEGTVSGHAARWRGLAPAAAAADSTACLQQAGSPGATSSDCSRPRKAQVAAGGERRRRARTMATVMQPRRVAVRRPVSAQVNGLSV